MRRTSLAAVLVIAPVMLLLSGGRATAQGLGTFDQLADQEALAGVVHYPSRSLCTNTGKGFHCFAKIRTDAAGNVQKSTSPQGYVPTDIQSAYKIPTTGGTGKTVAVIEAYHYANAEADLAVYRTQFNLPACTTANGCFKQVADDGTTNFGSADPGGCNTGWPGEASLDLQMVSASCPACKILIVEAPNDQVSFDPAVNTAASLGAVAISNSYGGSEDQSVLQDESAYTHAGILITASAGDNGYGASYPATSAGVLAVGGTTLKTSSSSRGWAETAWNSGGSGCSAVIPKPSWQTDAGDADGVVGRRLRHIEGGLPAGTDRRSGHRRRRVLQRFEQ